MTSSRKHVVDYNSETVSNKKTFYQRNKVWIWVALALLGIGIIVALVLLFAVPSTRVINNDSATSTPSSSTPRSKPDLKIIPQNLGSFDDSAQANPNVPPLNKPFPYHQTPVRGVNLGGWLVPEPFIVPSIFKDYANQGVVDEWTLCTKIGREACTKVLNDHYKKWVTEDEIKKIRDAGLDHIRIPIGYWALDIDESSEPFVYGAWDALLQGIQWARKYGIRVKVEFHGAPGSQNGWNHSGRWGTIRFLNTTVPESEAYVQRFNKILIDTVKYFSQPEWKNVVTMFGILNEPWIGGGTMNVNGTRKFYTDAYHAIRGDNNAGPILVFSEGFMGVDKWAGFMPKPEYERVVLDTHNYLIFDTELVKKDLQTQGDFPCTAWAKDFIKSDKNFGWTMCGEFSLATNDCGFWLNGINLGARYEGTYQLQPGPPACNNCTCKGVDDWKSFSAEKKEFLKTFAEKQMDSFEKSFGWFFWNFKTEDHINPHWDYFLGLDQGWISKDFGNRQNVCAASPAA